MSRALPRGLLAGVLLLPIVSAHAQGVDLLPPTTRLVAATGAPSTTQYDFTLTGAAQDLTVTLTDLQVPSALTSATVVVTQGSAIIGTQASPGSASLAPPATTATVSIPGATGTYTVRVLGTPSSSNNVGTFTVCVAPKANPSACIQDASTSGNITASSGASNPTLSTLSTTFTVTTGGSYVPTFADDQFPVALSTLPNVAIFQGSTPVAVPATSGSAINLGPGTYTLLAVAQADSTAMSGLFGLRIADTAGSAPLLDMTVRVGEIPASADFTNPSSQALSVNLVDFAFPTALGSGNVLVTAGSTVLGMASTTSGASSFAAPSGLIQVWSYVTAGAAAGTYEVDLSAAGVNVLQSVAGVANGSDQGFAFATAPVAAGSYQVNASDFQFPGALQSLKFAAAQGGVILGMSGASGPLNVTAAAGPVVLLVDATAPSSGSGVFDVNLQSSAATPQLVFDKTQAVSTNGLFDTQVISVGTSGNFDVTLTDLNFPVAFQSLAVLVSNGGNIVGKIFGGGTFSFAAATGTYQLTFIATPAAQQQYGLYGVGITNSPPVVTLTASPMTVTANATTTLSWTTSAATACTASGGTFTGPQPTGSGSLSVVVAQTTTYTLTCTGPGGSTPSSVTVTATAAPAKSGGGGAVDTLLLGLLGLLLAQRVGVPRRIS